MMDRRIFVKNTATISAAAIIAPLLSSFGNRNEKITKGGMNVSFGLITGANNPEEELKTVRDLGFSSCQLNVAKYSPELAQRISSSLEKNDLTATTLICMGPGKYTWNFTDGPSTIGLVPQEHRAARVERLKQGIDFCKMIGIPAVHAHFGFIPEDPKDVLYIEFIETMVPLGEYASKQGVDIYFESGQETPTTLIRAIEDIGTGNLFINYDTANGPMYGKGNPLDSLKLLGKYVKELHAKDALYPTNTSDLGKEVLMPEGEVDFPGVISYLKSINFEGNITIECELSGDKEDYIIRTKEYLENLIDKT